jgi:cobalt/nickel transport system permease protein
LISIVLVVQAFIFGDGGITTLGVNIFNMGVISSFVGFYSYKGVKAINLKVLKRSQSGLATAAFIGAWLALFSSAIACAVELWLAGTFPLVQGLVFMGIFHAVIGIVAEGFITALVIVTLATHRADLFSIDEEFSSKGAVSA